MSTYSAQTKNHFATALKNDLANGKIRMKAGSTTICDVPLEAVAADVSGAVLTLRGDDGTNPIGSSNKLNGTSVAAGTIDSYDALDSSNAVVWSGPASELTLDTLVITGAGVPVSFASGTHTVS